MLPNAKYFSEVLPEDMSTPKDRGKGVNWYYAPAFLLLWFGLLFAVVLPLFFNLPEGLTVESQSQHEGKFIAERAERILYDFDRIGPKVTGSHANENLTVQLLRDEVEKIRRIMHHDLFDMEVDLQVVSGAYIQWNIVNKYQALQNFVVKLSSKNSTSQNFLLINSHFDSKPGSPGSGDDGAMVVVMLEVLRVLSTNRETFTHPIVFLFNGAEEIRLQASHGFITQHKWAKHCKALINLDSAGSGNREILFQSGPNHPWLMKYYSKYAIRPYATTAAEELFQSRIIPSDTDFRIFRDYGHVPGLDLAHFYNGYVYHTKFDKADVIPRGTLQATGDNILSLAKALANAPELEDIEKHSEGHSVFYDFLGLFFVYYTETQGKIINTSVSALVIIEVAISLWLTAATSKLSIGEILKSFALIFLSHLAGVVLAVGMPILLAVILDSGDYSMSWFTNKWLVLGLYVCPALFGLALPSLLYLRFNPNHKLRRIFQIQFIQHAHAFILAFVCIVTTFRGLRSSYIFLIPLFFYGAAVIINLITTLYRHENLWCAVIILSQILPFLYTAYLFLIALSGLMPMMGRFGSTTNPDLLISALCALAAILSMGFLMPIWNAFRRSEISLPLLLLFVTFIFAMIALSPLGFPYRPKTNVGRINYLNVRRVFYEYDGSVSRNESGYYFDLQDRRFRYPQEHKLYESYQQVLIDDCKKYMMCGLPLFNNRMAKNAKQGVWLPSKEPTELPATPTLALLRKTFNSHSNTARFEFELNGPPQRSLFLLPLEGVTILDWPFGKKLLKQPYQAPYFISFLYGKLSTPYKFFFDLKLTNKTIDQPLFEMGISGHYIGTKYQRGKHAEEFAKQFPDYMFVVKWPSSYERYIF